MFDTGSTNTWVSTIDGKIDGKHLLFDPEKSTSFYMEGGNGCTINFGSGTLCGEFGYDDVWLNYNDKSERIHIERQQMGFVEKAEVFDDTFDCIVGLAFKKMAARSSQRRFAQPCLAAMAASIAILTSFSPARWYSPKTCW